jgi:pyridoxamine 5'-phosphate oxidase family protein
MSAFTEAEINDLKTQRLGRLATVGADGQPTWYRLILAITSMRIQSRPVGTADLPSARNIATLLTNPRVAFVIDDVPSVNPWTVRGIEICGQTQVLATGGKELGPDFDSEMFRIRPSRIISWGINSKDFYQQSARSGA